MTDDVVLDIEVKFRLSGSLNFGVEDFVAAFRFPCFFQWQVTFKGEHLHLLKRICLRDRDPYADLLPDGNILYGEPVMKCEVAGLLGKGSEGEGEEERNQYTELAQHLAASFQIG